MKKLLFIVFLGLCQIINAQSKGIIQGKITDKEMDGESLPFANVFIKGTSIGSTTDMDGNYTISAPAGQQTVVFSFIGYQTIEKAVNIIAGKTIVLNEQMGASEGVALDEIVITTNTNREKESALLLNQKKATIIKESIGAVRLAKTGVSNAGAATTKISGVVKSEGTGDIYIRGLGDRYLSTTMNGLPIPSDDVEKKNIDLGLFSTSVIKSVGISKTYATSSYADQASGNVDVSTKDYNKKGLSISFSGGSNTNVLGLSGDFRRTIISNDITLGFHQKQYALENLITFQGWDTETTSSKPINFSGSISGSKKFKFFGKDLSFYATASHSQSYNYLTGEFNRYRSNVLDNSFSDVEQYNINTNTTGYVNFKLKLNDNNTLKYNTLFVNKGEEKLYESGRNGLGFVFDQDPQEDGAFIRDQNFKSTRLFVNQLMGEHQWSENNELNWAAGYNFVLAEEPNRIRNEVNILDVENSPLIQFAHVGDFQQRKSNQKIQDTEYNAFLKNKLSLGALDEDEQKPYALNYGANFRRKERVFRSQFIGVRSRNFTAASVDNLSDTFTDANFNNGLALRVGEIDRYEADLTVLAAFANFDFKVDEKLSGNIGVRFENNDINVIWDVTNFVGRIGTVSKTYTSLFPSVNLKYELAENQYLRFASSVTQTIPEFKELSPFEYVSPTGRVTKGNPDLEKSDVYNADLKWEMFPESGQLFSASTFYKQIINPINLTQARGSSGNFIYENTGKKATVFGIELEARTPLIKNDDEQTLLSFNANLTRMWTNQDLFENFQYNGVKESNLQGASDLIINGALSFSDKKENEFNATISGNYSSDKIYVLGSPEDFASSDTLYNDEIIEKGFVSLDMVVSKQIGKHLTLKLVGKNLLNPKIEQTQNIRNLITGEETNETVLSYKRGVDLRLGVTYKF